MAVPGSRQSAQIAPAVRSPPPADQWYGLELRHLLALVAIAEEGSFGRAAVRLGYTQSAISQQIAALERIVGQSLVNRGRGTRPVSLTPAGNALVAHAEAIAERLVAARADIAVLDESQVTSVEIGTYQSVGAHILPCALSRFARARPEVTVRLTESNTDEELLELVAEGRLDLTFAMLPLGDGPFEWIELLRDPYVLLVRADSPLAERGTPPTPRDISKLELIGFRECRSVESAESQLRAAGITPKIVFRSNDNGTVQGLVAAGLGAALVPRLIVDPNDERVVALDLGDRVQPRVLALAWHRGRAQSPVVRDVADAVMSCVHQLRPLDSIPGAT
jgi:DNA-binding transcriptional LysR family regulator